MVTNGTERALIYSDPQYGMSNPKTMSTWVAAYLEAAGKYTGWEAPPSIVLINHFRTKGIYLTADIFGSIVNNSTS